MLAQDGLRLGPVVLAPVEAPGRRRLTAAFPGLLDASQLGTELDPQVDAALVRERPDVLVSWFWTRKLPRRWLDLPPRGAIGVHPSLLPRHRGPNPYFWSIDAGDTVTGVTVHRLEEEYDTGKLLGSKSIPVGQRDAWQLARALDRPSLELLRATVGSLARGAQVPEWEQDPAQVTWAPEPSGGELRVDFGWTTERVLRRIRALSPTPGVALAVEGVELFVTRAEPQSEYLTALFPGEAHISAELGLRTGDGAVRVTRAFFPEIEEEATTAADVAHLLKQLAAP